MTLLSRYEPACFASTFGPLLYRWLRPLGWQATSSEEDDGRRFPLVVFLHGAGERGDDNVAPLVHGTAAFSDPTRQQRDPCFVVVPQCPADDFWASLEHVHEPTRLAPEPRRPLQQVLELIHHAQHAWPIDSQRIYLTGLSMGGYGSWDLLLRYPTLFAAAIPICGGGDCLAPHCAELAQLPLWIFHGDQDDIVPVQRSREIVQALRDHGGSPQYTEYVGGGHDSWSETYANPVVLDWLFAQHRPTA